VPSGCANNISFTYKCGSAVSSTLFNSSWRRTGVSNWGLTIKLDVIAKSYFIRVESRDHRSLSAWKATAPIPERLHLTRQIRTLHVAESKTFLSAPDAKSLRTTSPEDRAHLRTSRLQHKKTFSAHFWEIAQGWISTEPLHGTIQAAAWCNERDAATAFGIPDHSEDHSRNSRCEQ
jgi:hypothetical protein